MSLPSGNVAAERTYVAVAVACVVLIALLLVVPIAPYDFWIHLATGRTIVREGHIPTVDTSLFMLPNAPIFDQPWLGQLLMYGLFAAGGPKLVLSAQAAMLAGAYALLLRIMIRRSGGRVRASFAALLVFVIPLTCPYWVVRPQTYTLPLFVLVLALTNGHRFRWGWPLWPLVPVMALWANLHGTFVMGVGVLGLVTAVEGARAVLAPLDGERRADALRRWRPLALCSTCAALATLLNPRGVAIYTFAFSIARSLNGSFGEWARPLLTSPFGGRFYVLAGVELLLFLRWWRVSRRPPPPSDLLLWLVLFAAATTSCRYIVWFGIAAGPLVAEGAAALLRPREPAPAKEDRAGLVFVAAVVVVLALVWWKRVLAAPDFEPYTPGTPIAAVERLRALDPALRPKRLFHNEAVGSYLLWAAPEQPIFIDPRFALYPPEQIADLIHLTNLVDLDRLIAKYGFDGMLLETEHQETLLAHIAADPAWTTTYRDATSALFVRAIRAP